MVGRMVLQPIAQEEARFELLVRARFDTWRLNVMRYEAKVIAQTKRRG